MQEFNPLYLHPYKYNQWSRVPRGPLAAAVGSFLFGATSVAFTVGAAAITWGTIGGFLITTAVASWAISALTPKPEGISGREGLLTNRREPVGNFDIVYGKVRKGGVITFMESTGEKNKYLHFIITLAGHQVEAIEDVYINENIVTLDSDGFVIGDTWKSKVRVKKMLGAPNQAAQPELVSETSVDSNFRGRGVAYLYVRLEYDNEVFAEGIPNFTAVVKGKRVWDPRVGQNVWTDNAALCIRDYLRDPLGVNSIQVPTSLTSDCWEEGADICDSVITKKDNSTEKRYTLNGVVSTANTPRENLQQMLTSCGGTLFWGQGQWQFKPGHFPSGPYVDLGMDDLRSGISLVTKNSRKENFNSVSGVFINSDKDWIETEYPRFSSSAFLAQDGGQENSLDMELPYTTSPSAAQRLAKMAMFRSREEIAISANFSLKASKIKVGDVVRFSFERYGFTNKYFEVLSWKLVSESNGLVINMTLKETSADAYDWNAEEKDILGNNTILPQPREGLSVSGLTVTNIQTLQSDGTLLGEVLLSWNPSDNAFVYRYDVQWRKNTESSWSSTQTAETEVVIPSIKSGVPYTYRVRAVSVGGFVGAWEQIGATVSGKNTPPGLPTNVQTKNLYRAVQVTWINPTDPDLNHIEIYTNTSNTSTGATKVGESGGTKFIYDMEPMESRWFFLRAVDHSGNKSGFTTGSQGTALFIEQSDVDIDVDQLLEDAGLNTVEVLPNLPTTGNFDGRTVYNTDDRQLYIYDGDTNQWKPAVEPFNPEDLILERENFPSDLKPVEVLTSLPTTGNFEGRVVMLLDDGKIYRYNNGSFTASVPTVDLTGTISTNQIANNAITTAKFASGLRPVEVVSTLPTTGNVNGRTVTLTTDGKLYRYHNGAWTASVPTVDLVGTVSTGQIADDAITSDKIGPLAVDAAALASNAVTAVKISNGAVEASKIATGAVTGVKIAENAVTSDKINNLAITEAKVAANAITVNKIANGAVEAGKISNGAINISKFATGLRPVEVVSSLPTTGNVNGRTAVLTTDGKLYRYHGGAWTATVPSIDITGQLTNAQIAAVSAAKLTGQITGTQISDNAITTPKIATGAVIANKIAANAIVADKIASNAVTSAKIEAGAVVAGKIATNAVTSDKIQANAITTGKIAAGAVAADQIAAGAVTASKVAISDFTNIVGNDLSYGQIDGWTITGFNSIDITSSSDGYYRVAMTGRNAYGPWVTAPDPEKQVYVSAKVWNSNPYNMGVGVHFQTEDGVNNWANVQLTSVNGSYQEVSGKISVPASAVRMRFMIVTNIPTGQTGNTMYFMQPQMRIAASGELIVDGAITTDKLNANAVTAGKIAANAITTGKIATGAVTATEIDTGAVTADKILANAVTAVKISSNAITADKIASNAVTTAKIDALAITSAKIAADAITSDKIQANAVGADQIAANAIVADKIASNAITSAKISSNAVTAVKIASNAITTAKLDANAVTTAKIAAGAVTATEIAAGTITTNKLAVANLENLFSGYAAKETSPFIPTASANGGQGSWHNTVTWEGQPSIRISGTWGGGNMYVLNTVPVNPGDQYYVAFWVASNNAWNGTSGNSKLRFGNQDGSHLFSIPYDSSVPHVNQPWELRDHHFTVPSGVTSLNITMVSNGTAGDVYIAGMQMRLKNKGELIVDGAITANKIEANAVTADKISSNAITSDKISSNAITSDKISSNAITSGKIAAGAIAADKIQAGAVSAHHLLIADFTNLVPNYDISDEGSWTIPSAWTRAVSGAVFDGAYLTRIEVTSGQTGYSPIVRSLEFSTNSGDQYYMSIQARMVSTGETGQLVYEVQWQDVAGNSLGTIWIVNASVVAASAQRFSNTLTAPNGAVRAFVRWRVNRSNTTGTMQVGSPTVRRLNGGELIVDGAITADKIASNSVNTGHLVANSVTAGVIASGAVNTAALAANAVTAAKINVNNLSAISADLGSITGGSININGNFIVNSNGNTTIRSGTSGERLVITQNRISVFDSNGTLRVRLGQL